MQKVSKQSLAMLALSILLAISIALTFTFAALNSTKTATGTITFSGNVSVSYTAAGTESTDGSVSTITLGEITYNGASSSVANAADNEYFTIKADKSAYITVTVTLDVVNDGETTPLTVVLKSVDIDGAEGAEAQNGATLNSTTKTHTYNFGQVAINDDTTGIQLKVNDIIESISFSSEAELADSTITIKVDAHTNN